METVGSLSKHHRIVALLGAICLSHATVYATLMPFSQLALHQVVSHADTSATTYSNNSLSQIIDDFMLDQDASVLAITWWGGSADGSLGENDSSDQVPAFNIEFFTSDPATGGVGTSIYETVVSVDETNITQTDQELPGGSNVFQYTFILDDVVNVEAGQSYWFSVSANLDTDTVWDWFYDQFAGNNVDIEDILSGIGEGRFYIPCIDLDIPCVVICVPEPSTLLLFACGSLVLTRRLHRKRIKPIQ